MPTVGETRRDRLYKTGKDYGNVVWDGAKMPEKGWITSFRLNFGGDERPIAAKLCIWDRPDFNLIYSSEERQVPSGSRWHSASSLAVPMDAGKEPLLGFWRDADEPCEFYAQRDTVGRANREFQVYTYTARRDAPRDLGSDGMREGILCREFTYRRQERPLQPQYLAPTPLEGDISNLDLTVAVTLPHGDDADFDHTERVQIRVVRTDVERTAYDQWHEVEPGATTFTYKIPSRLEVSRKYKILTRHQDTWGSSSHWRERNFTTSAGPDAPQVTAPQGRITAQKPADFRMTYSNPLGSAYGATQVEIWNERGTSRMQQSAFIVGTGTPDEIVVPSTWMSNLSWGRRYWGRARHRDAAGNTGGWTWFAFFTNAAPRVPYNMSPSGGRFTPFKVLRCDLSDPDGDPITAVNYEVRRKSDNVLVESGNMDLDASGRRASKELGAMVVSDIAYKWIARASDGALPSPSSWSGQQEFTWAPVPEVAMVLPNEIAPRNLVEDPSFEYATTYWTPFAEVPGVNEIMRITDAESYVGEWSMRGVVSDSLQGSPIRRSAFIGLDTTRPYYFSAKLVREYLADPTATHLAVECYNATGLHVGTIYPGTLPQGIDVGNAWQEFEGFVGPASLGYTMQFPAGTTQYRWVFEPSRGANSVVRLDAVYMRQLSSSVTAEIAAAAQRWLGYFDGDTASYRPGVNTLDFEWELVTGASVSRGLNVLEYPQTQLGIRYTSPGASLKSNERLFIDQYVRNRWQQIYDSGWTGGPRTIIPLPVGYLRNGQFYRLKVQARDSATTPRVGESEWVEFQTQYQGPEALTIVESLGDPDHGSMTIRWQRSELSQLAFAGYEIAYAPFGSRVPTAILAHIGNPEITEYTWHEPAATNQYYLMVRQVENVGAEQLQGDWSRTLASVEFRKWFLKSLSDPEGMQIGFDLQAEDVVAFDYPAEETELDLWGARQPSYYTEDRDQAVGSIIIRLKRGDPQLEQKQEALRLIKRNRRFGAILQTTYPSRVYHMHLSAMNEEFSDLPWESTWTIGLKQMYYEQDYYLREGLAIAQL